jgi:hypothetical protein
MDFLNKVSREDLEEMIESLMEDIESDCPDLAKKYKAELEEYIYCISMNQAHEIVHKMLPYGEKFSYDLVEQFLANKEPGLEESDIIDYYLVMNMFYNDYKECFDKYSNLNQKDIYYDFSRAFIHDKDAPKYKTEKYFLLFG